MKILLIGEIFSNNLGDPLLCGTVRNIIEEAYNQAQIFSLDLSGKTGFNSYHQPVCYSTHQRWYFRLSNCFPQLCEKQPLYRTYRADEPRHMRPLSMLEELLGQHRFDAAVFAGGALFMDYFAAAIHGIVKRLDMDHIPTMFHACGMGSLSEDSIKLLRRTFRYKNVTWISLRDSYPRFLELFPCKIPVSETYDTALLCSRYHRPSTEKRAQLGIGIIEGSQYYDFQKKLVDIISHTEKSWMLFTNGSPGDDRTAQQIAEQLSIPHDRVCCPQTLEESIQTISGFQGIISFRMHTQIVAASCGIPSFGFLWDSKIRDFYQKLGYPDNFVDTTSDPDLDFIFRKLDTSSEVLFQKARTAGEESKKSLLEGLSLIMPKEVHT